VDDADDIPDGSSSLDECMDRRAQGYINGRGAHLESGITENLGRCIGIFLAQIRQEDVLACATRRAIG
jgi:hypothetical protein